MQIKCDVTSLVLFTAILHHSSMACNGDIYGFLIWRVARTYRICEIQHFSKKVEYLTRTA